MIAVIWKCSKWGGWSLPRRLAPRQILPQIRLKRRYPLLRPGCFDLLRLPLVSFHQVAEGRVFGRAARRAAMLVMRVHAKQILLIVRAELKHQIEILKEQYGGGMAPTDQAAPRPGDGEPR